VTDPITSIHFASDGNFATGQYAPAADGFNLADVSSLALLNSLPNGVKGLVFLGSTSGATAIFRNNVAQYVGNSHLYDRLLGRRGDRPRGRGACNPDGCGGGEPIISVVRH
jgi:hypothetical protein